MEPKLRQIRRGLAMDGCTADEITGHGIAAFPRPARPVPRDPRRRPAHRLRDRRPRHHRPGPRRRSQLATECDSPCSSSLIPSLPV